MRRVDRTSDVDSVSMEIGKHYINLTEKEIGKSIYRVFSVPRLLEMLKSSRNNLAKPSRWDDPFENFILRSTARYQEQTVHFESKDYLYGQCWTLHRESDAMWRIYAPDKNGVTVRTSIRKLLESLALSAGDIARVSCFIGKVEYRSEADLVDMVKNRTLMNEDVLDPLGSGQAWTLMWKRREFRHEKEVRLVYFNHDKNFTDDFFSYTIDPLDLFEEIVFDPRMTPEMYEVFKGHLASCGFSGRVHRSSLYRIPQLEMELFGESA